MDLCFLSLSYIITVLPVCSSQVITEALVAFTWLLKFPLPAVEQNAGQLTKQLFVLLKDYSKAGAARGENYHLVQNCFKVERKKYNTTSRLKALSLSRLKRNGIHPYSLCSSSRPSPYW